MIPSLFLCCLITQFHAIIIAELKINIQEHFFQIGGGVCFFWREEENAIMKLEKLNMEFKR